MIQLSVFDLSLGAVLVLALALTSARIYPGMAWQLLVAALRTVLHIVGIGPLSGELGRRASRGRLAGHVSLHGAIPHTRMGAYYRAADLCLLSSHFESSGMVIMEAAACGKLTVGASVGSMPEITPSAYRVSPGDATALAAVIERCVDSPDDVDTIGRQVAARVAERYSVESMIDRYSAAYERLSQ